MIRPRPYASGNPVMMCERRAASTLAGYASKTPSLWVLRYFVKISVTIASGS